MGFQTIGINGRPGPAAHDTVARRGLRSCAAVCRRRLGTRSPGCVQPVRRPSRRCGLRLRSRPPARMKKAAGLRSKSGACAVREVPTCPQGLVLGRTAVSWNRDISYVLFDGCLFAHARLS